jgi:hypothetical protein
MKSTLAPVAASLVLVVMAVTSAPAEPPRALSLVAAPSQVNVVTFQYRSNEEDHKVVVTTSPTLVRIDQPEQRYSFLYNPATQCYTGLEHSNYTYWSFSWPEVKDAVEASKRGEKRLQDLANEGLNPGGGSSATNNAPDSSAAASSLATGDDSGYVWRPTTEKKRIAELDCTRWTGETEGGETCDAWCYAGPLPRVTEALATLRAVNEPMSLVPVREVVPDFIFTVFDALTKGGVTPVAMNWGSNTERTTFRLVEEKTRPYDAKLFVVPKLYVKTTLITMDGLVPEQPAPDLRGSPTAPRPDHLNTNPSINPGLQQ